MTRSSHGLTQAAVSASFSRCLLSGARRNFEAAPLPSGRLEMWLRAHSLTHTQEGRQDLTETVCTRVPVSGYAIYQPTLPARAHTPQREHTPVSHVHGTCLKFDQVLGQEENHNRFFFKCRNLHVT